MKVAIGPVNSTADNVIDHGMWPSGLGRRSRKFGSLKLEIANQKLGMGPEMGQKKARKWDLSKVWAGKWDL